MYLEENRGWVPLSKGFYSYSTFLVRKEGVRS